ncbi:MAG TPA: hypothetical protein VF062_26615 [Candidatus Limnocylindrales bacterium]
MSSQPTPPIVPAAAVARDLAEDEQADARRDEQTAEDGTPVGEADHREDIIRSGGDPDEAS